MEAQKPYKIVVTFDKASKGPSMNHQMNLYNLKASTK